ncbi:hypothetical protein JAAARDRAFT_187385 [Jaapia argillacea MUCL 33604]|uniref:Retrotransposon gag domain-containing protein n=1 Tax=Jaapia argillacea MUCL 33604 TaxID=933084 RepID=A0A067QCX5_9AGAM|nr:hypothetical protein JAAARDRAFT_187385 [Jaapia argillacea MUCL 33604]
MDVDEGEDKDEEEPLQLCLPLGQVIMTANQVGGLTNHIDGMKGEIEGGNSWSSGHLNRREVPRANRGNPPSGGSGSNGSSGRGPPSGAGDPRRGGGPPSGGGGGSPHGGGGGPPDGGGGGPPPGGDPPPNKDESTNGDEEAGEPAEGNDPHTTAPQVTQLRFEEGSASSISHHTQVDQMSHTHLAPLYSYLNPTAVVTQAADYKAESLHQFLRHEALSWFNHEIDTPSYDEHELSFEKVICAMHIRFLHKATAQKVVHKFYNCQYSSETEVAAFYNTLDHNAGRMVVAPDDYTFRREFLAGLPESIRSLLMQNRGVNAEFTPSEVMYREAIKMETSLRFLRQQQHISGSQ